MEERRVRGVRWVRKARENEAHLHSRKCTSCPSLLSLPPSLLPSLPPSLPCYLRRPFLPSSDPPPRISRYPPGRAGGERPGPCPWEREGGREGGRSGEGRMWEGK